MISINQLQYFAKECLICIGANGKAAACLLFKGDLIYNMGNNPRSSITMSAYDRYPTPADAVRAISDIGEAIKYLLDESKALASIAPPETDPRRHIGCSMIDAAIAISSDKDTVKIWVEADQRINQPDMPTPSL